MKLSIEFNKPEAITGHDWQLSQEVNVKNEAGDVIAKAEIELLTLNKHRDASATYKLLADEETDWEIPLNIYFKKQNLTEDLCKELHVSASTKAQTHILVEAISVLPQYRRQGVGQYLLQEIAKKHEKIQSITVLSLAMNTFVDAENCETAANQTYYQQLDLANETLGRKELAQYFGNNGFTAINVDEEQLIEPLTFDVFVASPNSILATK
jgi:GNAT superfamily N-acetyltransferase